MIEHTSIEVSKRLAATGFKTDFPMLVADEKVREPVSANDEEAYVGVYGYARAQLEDWLFTVPIFSKRAASLTIRRMLLHGDDKRVSYVVVDQMLGGDVVHGAAVTLADALAEVVMKVLEWKS